ncbi:unnamed protein product, partial [Oncorhynchus mykiss]
MEMEPLGVCVSKPEQGNSRVLKAALAACVCFCIALLLAVILVSQRANQDVFCLTPECIEAAGSILSKMDRAVSPCDDFYGFSCGSWLRDNPIPEDSSSYGVYPWLRQHVDITLKDEIRSCQEGQGTSTAPWYKVCVCVCVCLCVAILEKVDSGPLLKLLQQPEFHWPVLGEGLGGEWLWSPGRWDLLQTLAQIRNQHSKSVLIRLYIAPDDKNSTNYIIKVTPLTECMCMRVCVHNQDSFQASVNIDSINFLSCSWTRPCNNLFCLKTKHGISYTAFEEQWESNSALKVEPGFVLTYHSVSVVGPGLVLTYHYVSVVGPGLVFTYHSVVGPGLVFTYHSVVGPGLVLTYHSVSVVGPGLVLTYHSVSVVGPGLVFTYHSVVG